MQFSVDTDRCISCGLCLSDCLPRALGMDGIHFTGAGALARELTLRGLF